MSRVIRAITRDGSARALIADTRDTVNEAIKIHGTEPTASAALGRVLTACSMMGTLLGEEEDMLTVRFKGDGEGGSVVASSDWKGNVRGFIQNPACDLPLRPDGKLNVGCCIGKGLMYVLRDTGGEEPYVGIANIVSGEIAEDIASYYANSEQVPTVCALGVLVDRDRTCAYSGGALIQLLPFADPAVTEQLEKNASSAPPITKMLAEKTLEEILAVYLEGIEYDVFDEIQNGYECNCSRERTDRALISLGKKELTDIYESDEQTEMTCQFCGRKYTYTKDEILKLIKEAKA